VGPVKSPDELTELFRARGLRVTAQRQCIFRLLEGNEAHPTAEWVYQRAHAEMPTMSLKTVYETLRELASIGEIQMLDLGTGSARFDPNVGRHQHLVCERCGRTRDINIDVSGLESLAPQTDDFTIANVEIVFRGQCAECSSTEHEMERN
jgi:Fur family peroxide stress response transcriptional regulator